MNSRHAMQRVIFGATWTLWAGMLLGASPTGSSASLPQSSSHYGIIETQSSRFKNVPLFKKADQAVGRNDTATAIQLFNQILHNDPGHNAAKLYLITLYDQVGRYNDALSLCDDLIRHYPDYIPVYISKGNVAVKNGQYDLAALTWEEALKRAPADFPGRRETLISMGQAYCFGARYADAKRAYTQALALAFDPVTGLACFYVLKAIRKSEEGRPLLERVLAGSPPPDVKEEALYELAQLDRQIGWMPDYVQRLEALVQTSTNALRLHDGGLQLYAAGRPELALEALKKGFDLETQPQLKIEIGLFIAEVYLQQNRTDDARRWLEEMAPLAGTDTRWTGAMARADFIDGNYRACIDRLTALPERSAGVNLLMGFAFLKRGMPGLAWESLNAIDDPDELSPADQLMLYRNRAYLNFDQNQYDLALTDAVEAMAIKPSADMALVHLKSLANITASNDVEKVGARLLNREESGLRLTSAEQAQILLVMGRHLYRQAQYNNAVNCLTDSVKLDPSLVEAFYLRSVAYHALDKPKEALIDYREYVRMETNPPATFWGDLGQAEGQRGEYTNGTAALQRSLEYYTVDVDTLSDQSYQFMKWAFPYRGTNQSILSRNHNQEAKQSFQRASDLYADLVPRVPTNQTAAYRDREVAMKQEYTKLDHMIGIQGYVTRTDYGFPTNVGISSVAGALPSQGGLELSLRPPVIGFLNERTLDVFGNISGNFEHQSWTPDPDSYQGMVGLRVKPFISLNYNMSFARLFKIGDNAEDNWLWRNMASWECGEKPAPGNLASLNLKLFGDVGYYFDPRARWYGYFDGRAGPLWQLSKSVFLTIPQVLGILRYETNDAGDIGSYGLVGIGATLRLFEPERRYTINRLYVDIFIDYTWGKFMSTPNGFDSRSFEGPIIGINLLK